MTEAIIVAVLALVGTVVSTAITARATQNKITSDLKTQNEVQNTKINQLSTDISNVSRELHDKLDYNSSLYDVKFGKLENEINILKEDIKSHNHYAQLFNERVPVLQERQEVANNRIRDLETTTNKILDKLEQKADK